jgi:hypothetical protein
VPRPHRLRNVSASPETPKTEAWYTSKYAASDSAAHGSCRMCLGSGPCTQPGCALFEELCLAMAQPLSLDVHLEECRPRNLLPSPLWACSCKWLADRPW